MTFSERMGVTSARTVLQVDGMDQDLRTALYNYLYEVFKREWSAESRGYVTARLVWTEYWRRRVDSVPGPSTFYQELHRYVTTAPWNEVYDLIEFCMSSSPLVLDVTRLNDILARDMAGYRVRGGIVVPITDEVELSAIDEALALSDQYKGARTHLSDALVKLGHRPEPDLRNAITEAMSAVESAARVISGNRKATLGDALKVLEASGHVHPALKEAWLRLYGYTSDEAGLRHAMIEDPDIDFATAKYMVISCAAFVNLLAASG